MATQAVPTTSDSGSAITPSHKENVVMNFAYKADLIFEVMVTQRRESRLNVYVIPNRTGQRACERCSGTGMFITAVVNGQPAGPGGICYRCAGKGFQTIEDSHRNYGYDNYYMRVSL